MRIVVTGALGHIGSRLIRSLPQTFPKAEIVLVDNLATQRYASLFHLPADGRFVFHEADVLQADLAPLLRGAHAVVHLAALTDAVSSFGRTDEVEAVNLRGTERVATACAAAGARLVFLSTTSVYGPHGATVDEACPPSDLRPQSPYAESKLKAERLLDEFARTRGLRHTTFRFGTIFGTSVGMRFHTAVNKFCWLAVTGRPLTVWRDALHQKRPYLDLADGVAAIEFALGHDLSGAGLYNVVTANATVNEVVSLIRRHVPDAAVEFVDTPILNQHSYEVSSERLRGKGFKFHGDLARGIEETIEWLSHLRAA